MESNDYIKKIEQDILKLISRYEYAAIYSDEHKSSIEKRIYEDVYSILRYANIEQDYDIEVYIDRDNNGSVNISPKLNYITIEGKLEL